MRTDHSAAAVLGLPAWKKYNVTLDHPCVPIDNVVRNNCWTSVGRKSSLRQNPSSLSSDCAQDAIGENDTIFDETCYPVSSRPAGVSVDAYIRQYMAENWLTTATDGNHKCTAAELRMAGK